MPESCTELSYNRTKAIAYAHYWACRRNPAYLDFSEIGGNCTNFVSQCLYAGSGVMNYTPTFGWYYINSEDRTASWTGVEYLYNFLTQNLSSGPYGSETDLSGIAPGDVVQFANEEGKFVHTALITLVPLVRRYSTVLVAAHSNDSDCRPLDTYAFPVMRFIHIDGVRSCKDGNTEQPTDRNSPPSKFYRPVF